MKVIFSDESRICKQMLELLSGAIIMKCIKILPEENNQISLLIYNPNSGNVGTFYKFE